MGGVRWEGVDLEVGGMGWEDFGGSGRVRGVGWEGWDALGSGRWLGGYEGVIGIPHFIA